MTKQEALQVLSQACQMVKATFQEHQVLQQALMVLAQEQNEKATPQVTQNGDSDTQAV
jgi:hypothetical protein